MKPVLPYGRQDIDADDIDAVVECLRSDWLTQGPRVEAFEEALRETTGARYAVVVSSATAGLHLAALALNVQPGDTGVTSPITFVASANALRYAGAEVSFADVEGQTGLMDTGALERCVDELVARGRAPRVIVPVDYSGQPADLPAIQRIASRCGASVLADAAHSLGGEYRHESRTYRVGEGAHADATVLSFHPVKQITSAEGGAVLTSDAVLYRRLRELRSHGIHRDAERYSRATNDPMVGPWYYEQDSLGFNYRLTDLQCALGRSQLRRLEAFVARRRDLAARYGAALSRPPLAGQLAPLHQHPERRSAFHLYVVRVLPRPGEQRAEVAERRKRLYLYLQSRGIHTQVHYIPVTYHPYYRQRAERDWSLPAAEDFYAGCLSLPLFPAMADSDLERVVTELSEWFTKAEG